MKNLLGIEAAHTCDRIRQLRQLIATEDTKIGEAAAEKSEAEQGSLDLKDASCDGSPATIESIEARRHSARFHVRRGREIEEHHRAIRDELETELQALLEAERPESFDRLGPRFHGVRN